MLYKPLSKKEVNAGTSSSSRTTAERVITAHPNKPLSFHALIPDAKTFPQYHSHTAFVEPQIELSRGRSEPSPRILFKRRAVLARCKADVEFAEQFHKCGAEIEEREGLADAVVDACGSGDGEALEEIIGGKSEGTGGLRRKEGP